jgi:hypothetical protein
LGFHGLNLLACSGSESILSASFQTFTGTSWTREWPCISALTGIRTRDPSVRTAHVRTAAMMGC